MIFVIAQCLIFFKDWQQIFVSATLLLLIYVLANDYTYVVPKIGFF